MGGGVWIKGRCVCPCFGVFEAPSRLPISPTVMVLSVLLFFLLFRTLYLGCGMPFVGRFYLFSVLCCGRVVLLFLFGHGVVLCVTFWCFSVVLLSVGGVVVWLVVLGCVFLC